MDKYTITRKITENMRTCLKVLTLFRVTFLMALRKFAVRGYLLTQYKLVVDRSDLKLGFDVERSLISEIPKS